MLLCSGVKASPGIGFQSPVETGNGQHVAQLGVQDRGAREEGVREEAADGSQVQFVDSALLVE